MKQMHKWHASWLRLVVGALAIFALAASGMAAAQTATAATPSGPLAVSGKPDESKTVAQATPVTAATGAAWGAAALGGVYEYPLGKIATGQETGAGDRGFLQMAAGKSAMTLLPAVSQRDIAVDSKVVFEWLGMPKTVPGGGISFATQVRRTGGTYYAAVLHIRADEATPTSSTQGTTDLTIQFVNEADSSKNRTIASAALGKLSVNKAYRVQFEADGANIPTLRARVFDATSSAPEWQVTVADSAADRITTAGAMAYSGSTAADTTTSNVRVYEFTARSVVQGQAEASGYGAPTLGTGTYPVPADATKVIWVDPSVPRTADDWAPGQYVINAANKEAVTASNKPIVKLPITPNRTVATISNAIRQAGAGDVIVVKGGVYHEQITLMKGSEIIIQPQNGAKVWLDGSSAVTGWKSDGAVWSTAWTAVHPHDPTYTWGASDSTELGQQFVNSAYPLAAYPDQVSFNGVQLDQVASKAAVSAGTFFFDEANGRLYIGRDPAGAEVRASDLEFALRATTNLQLRGVGIRNYATAVVQRGALSFFNKDLYPGGAVQDVIIEANSGTGVYSGKLDLTFTNVTSRYNGLTGIEAGTSVSNISLIHVAANHNNAEWFNRAPVAAGAKLSTNSSNITVRDSEFADNVATGLWLDENITNFTIASNLIRGNSEIGLTVEISDGGTIVNNVVRDNVYRAEVGPPHNNSSANVQDNPVEIGIWLPGTSNAKVWNNTVTGSYFAFGAWQDRRVWGGKMWISANNQVHNNLFAASSTPAAGSWCGVVCVFDKSGLTTAPMMFPDIAGNAYHRESATSRPILIRFDRVQSTKVVGTEAAEYPTLAASGIDLKGREFTGALPVQVNGMATPELQAQASAASGFGTPIPADIAALTAGTASPLSAGLYTIGAARP